MQKTIFTILTDETARNAKAVEANLDQEFSVGAPWFSKSIGDLAKVEPTN